MTLCIKVNVFLGVACTGMNRQLEMADLSGKYVLLLGERRRLSMQTNDAQRQLRTSVLANLALTSMQVAASRGPARVEAGQGRATRAREGGPNPGVSATGDVVHLVCASDATRIRERGSRRGCRPESGNQPQEHAPRRASRPPKTTWTRTNTQPHSLTQKPDICNHLEITGACINGIIECIYGVSQLNNGKRHMRGGAMYLIPLPYSKSPHLASLRPAFQTYLWSTCK
ncbi:hypothetical protein BC830DRAFT_778203 [Chytriomyces sp. MP71]|nr:hypothetical protein BC830DRAFT_778203 [Chytriomyces sp. MP71]